MLQDNGRCEPMLQILQLLFRDTNVFVCPMDWASMPERRPKKAKTLSSNGTSVGELAESSRAANEYWTSFRRTKNPLIGYQLFVQISRFLKVFIEFLIVSCKALSWREEPCIGLWSIIFGMAANTSILPFWYLAFNGNQVSS